MAKIIIFCILSAILLTTTGQRITTIHLDGVQYFISRMNPYSPELNYFLAYQYCRSLGLQLASFETKEKAESMTTYLKNAGYGNYDFWTSGNRLGTGMFLWMSTGLPFNATFDFFENSADAIQAGLLDPVDHNSNTSPQRTARDSSSGAEKGCVILKQPTLKWMPEDCSAVKDFICEQTRCYYYNYGSIPVSSAQGRPITSTTTRPPVASALPFFHTSTTPLPIMMSTFATSVAKSSQQQLHHHQVDHSGVSDSQPSFVSLKLNANAQADAWDSAAAAADQTDDHDHYDDINADDDDGEHIDASYDEQHARELNDVKGRNHLNSLSDNDLHHRPHHHHQQHQHQHDESGQVVIKQLQQQLHESDDEHESVAVHEDEDGSEEDHNSKSVERKNGNDNDGQHEHNATADDVADADDAAAAVVDDDANDSIVSSANDSASSGFLENDDSHGKENVLNSLEKLSGSNAITTTSTDAPTVEVRLKQISQEIQQMAAANGGEMSHHHFANHKNIGGSSGVGGSVGVGGVHSSIINHDDINRQSFLSLTDLIRTLRPNDKQVIPQIDSDYSNAMRVLGEPNVGTVPLGKDEIRAQQYNKGVINNNNRALF